MKHEVVNYTESNLVHCCYFNHIYTYHVVKHSGKGFKWTSV